MNRWLSPIFHAGLLVAGLTQLPFLLTGAPALVSNHDSYFPGEPIAIQFSDGPGNRKDWVGVYPDGVVPGSTGSTIWRYVDNTAAGKGVFRDGVVTFPSGLNLGGLWNAHFLLNMC